MEERRGESSDVWLQKAGDARLLTEDEVIAASKESRRQHMASVGIDPELTDSAQLVRLAEIKRGDNLTDAEYVRALAHHVGAGGGRSGVFHALLKLRLGQA